jgi:hypothetical protein
MVRATNLTLVRGHDRCSAAAPYRSASHLSERAYSGNDARDGKKGNKTKLCRLRKLCGLLELILYVFLTMYLCPHSTVARGLVIGK